MQINRERAAQRGRDTLRILESGVYRTPSGREVHIGDCIAQSASRTQSYPPDADVPVAATGQHDTLIMVTNETTLSAARRLAEGSATPLALNFASARHPGGGFLSGARAQEESLARASALYACLRDNPMYAWHEAHRDPLYSDYAIYSPDVPVFRDDDGTLLEQPYCCAFLSCAAVNAKVALEREPARLPAIRAAMARRVRRILAIAAAQRHTQIVLGAWGCGVFGNDAHVVATLFKAALDGPYRGTFEAVAFAIVDWSAERHFIGPFERALGRPAPPRPNGQPRAKRVQGPL